MEWLAENYLWLKVVHLFAVIAWMAGLFYLPRLYAYHASVPVGSETSELFKVMERRLLRIIMNPAMIIGFLFGFLMVIAPDMLDMKQGWIHVKFTAAFALAGYHGFLAVQRKKFERDDNQYSEKFYRVINEIPSILLIIIIIMAIVRPF